jgi:DNA modification methylase
MQGDALEKLRELPDESVHCCVTSPPYWGLRDYGACDCATKAHASDSFLAMPGSGRTAGQVSPADARCKKEPTPDCPACNGSGKLTSVSDSQLGLEKTPEEYVAKMVEIFREVRRVLRKDGTLWLNLGDSYGSGTTDRNDTDRLNAGMADGHGGGSLQNNTPRMGQHQRSTGLKPKDLCGIPWRLAFALQADGWYLRSDIIWSKPRLMPESVTDRPTKSHEYLFLLTKSARYFYDAEAIKEPHAYDWTANGAAVNKQYSEGRARVDESNGAMKRGGRNTVFANGPNPAGRNKRSVWTVATAPYPQAHFATYPPDLIKPCILAGTSSKGCCTKCGAPWERIVERGSRHAAFKRENPDKTPGWQPTCECCEITDRDYLYFNPIPCTVLDPFAGSGTTGAVALELGRKAILIELNQKYVELIEERCNTTLGLALA